MKQEEQFYIEQLKKGIYSAFEYIYKQYSPLLFGYTLKLTKSKARAEAIVQDVFIKLWIHRESIDTTRSFKSFLFQIAKNHLIDEFRTRLNDPIFHDFLFQEYSSEPAHDPIEEKNDFDEFIYHLDRAKKLLTPRQRELFVLNKEQGFTPKEIATKFSLSEQTVYNQLHASMQIIQKEMKQYLPLLFFMFQ